MLEGKRNRRIDHLIYILVCKTVPYFSDKHRRQRYGFEGPDLEVKRRQEIEVRAHTIPRESVKELVETQLYRVLSQSHANRQYTVDINLYTCDCAGFPSIMYCKHIRAVQVFFHETVTIPPFISILPQQPYASPVIPPIPSSSTSAQPPTQLDDTGRMLTGIREKFLLVSHRTQLASSSTAIGQSLNDLDHALDQVLSEYPSERALIPSAKLKIAPNQHSWPETVAVMGARPKGKRKRVHTDAYAGGEKSGKKAKTDARAAPSRYV